MLSFSCPFPADLLSTRGRGLYTYNRRQHRINAVGDKKVRSIGDVNEREREKQTLALEIYSNDTTKRYMVDSDARLHIFNESQIKDKSNGKRGHIFDSQSIKDFILPAGFPDTVSGDYLEYMVWQFPTNVTAWICRTLVTSSLLKAVGVGSWPVSTATAATTAAASAAIKWVSKDGVGALGRLFIGGRFGGLFDNDPKQWRMYADFIGSAGSIFELATPLAPEYFLLLASVGNLTKAIARGLKDPSFRVIQNHFAISENLGDVAAKEEVWEVCGQISGLIIGVLILAAPGLVTSYPNLALTWMSLRFLHLWLRYQSLQSLRFSTINLKRARILVEHHISCVSVPGVNECNKQENILCFEMLLNPHICFGCSLEQLIEPEGSKVKLETLLDLYRKENYVLVIHSNSLKRKEARIAFKIGATNMAVLRSLWQAYWLYINGDAFNKEGSVDQFHESSKENFKNTSYLIDDLRTSLTVMNESFDDFLFQIKYSGWDVNKLVLKVPTKVFIIENNIDGKQSET